MAIKQLTVFVENKKGTMVSVTDILSQNNVNIRALSIAETKDFGILRLIVNDDKTAIKALTDKDYLVKSIDVVGVKIGDAVNVYIKSILPEKMKVKLVIISKAENNMPSKEIKYFITEGHIDFWRYSTDSGIKNIYTDFT